MTQIPATPDMLQTAYLHLNKDSNNKENTENIKMLLKLYALECLLKYKFLINLRPPADTKINTDLIKSEFGRNGHDLISGLQAIRAPKDSSVPLILVNGDSVKFQEIHQIMRYHIPYTSNHEDLKNWLEEKIEQIGQNI